MAKMIFYKRPEALNSKKHAKLMYTAPADYSFARDAVAVPLMAIEFGKACRQYPIVFAPDAKGEMAALAVLSLDQSGNAFLDDKGQWTAQYIPAFVRRYPFVLADISDKKGELAVAFDADSGCFGSGKGEPLFDESGKPAAVLQKQIKFLEEFSKENQRTRQFIKVLKDEDLLRPINFNITRAGDSALFAVKNTVTVDEAKLQKLAGDKAATFLSSGLLAITHAHLISLQNFDTLANRMGNPSNEVAPWWAR